MANLAVNFAGLELKNPLIVASSELTDEFEKIKWAEDFGASAISTKLAFLQVPFYARPYHVWEKGGGFYSPSGHRLNVDEAQELIRKTKEQTDLKVIANMMGPGENLEGWVTLAQMLEEAGSDMVELNMSCPNVGLMAEQMKVDVTDELGAHLGKNPVLAREVCKAISQKISIPVMAKMTPEGQCDIVAEGCFEGGAAAVSAINCPMSLPGCDIYDDGKPLYPGTTNQSFAGICGPWIRPLAYRHVAQIAMKCPDGPIAGGGGLSNWQQSVQMFMYGASVVTYCTLLYTDGHKAIRRIEKGLRRYMEEQGYETINDFKGVALKHIVTPQNVDYYDVWPEVDEDKCNGCKKCVELGHCEVLTYKDKKAKVTAAEKCYHCGVCFWICPEKSITMVQTLRK
jgi:dihydroorotate dehydrogenase/NAD-dependent dihydropyrimidine dehydrogenase PreA subunit